MAELTDGVVAVGHNNGGIEIYFNNSKFKVEEGYRAKFPRLNSRGVGLVQGALLDSELVDLEDALARSREIINSVVKDRVVDWHDSPLEL